MSGTICRSIFLLNSVRLLFVWKPVFFLSIGLFHFFYDIIIATLDFEYLVENIHSIYLFRNIEEKIEKLRLYIVDFSHIHEYPCFFNVHVWILILLLFIVGKNISDSILVVCRSSETYLDLVLCCVLIFFLLFASDGLTFS